MYIWRNTEARAYLRMLTVLRWSYPLTYWYHTFCCCCCCCCCWRMYVVHFCYYHILHMTCCCRGLAPSPSCWRHAVFVAVYIGVARHLSSGHVLFLRHKNARLGGLSQRTNYPGFLYSFLPPPPQRERERQQFGFITADGRRTVLLGFFMYRVEDSNSHEKALHC